MAIHIGLEVCLWNNLGISWFSLLSKHFNILEYTTPKFNGQF